MKTCLVYSVKDDPKHITQLNFSLQLAKCNLFPFVPGIHTIFFCDVGAKEPVRTLVKKIGITDFTILNFNTVQPEYAPHIQSLIRDNISYKNMCRFWAGEIFKTPEVLAYDYYMRLDCDSYITSPFGFNPFAKLDSNNKIYGFLSGGFFYDSPDVCKDLNKTLKKFEVENNSLIISSVDNIKEGSLYYTNFEVCKIKAFSESSYMNLYEYLDKSGGIYIYRWGDHIIRYAGVNMLLGSNLVEEFKGVPYTHQRFINGKIV